MKKFLLILGEAIVFIVLIVALFLGLSYYLIYSIHARGMVVVHTPQTQSLQAIDPGKSMNALVASDPVIVDPRGYQTEDQWIATMISQEVADMAFLASHPDQPLPTFVIKVKVDPDQPQVHAEILGYAPKLSSSVTADLTPAFAWDPEGYAPLARQLLGNTTGSALQPETDATDVLSHLLTLTGSELALEDVRLSGELQQHPASAQDHDAAALILSALALRENAGRFSDNRKLLNRATAHLALAEALRGDQPATWPGLIADASIRALAGREVDALAHLDTLAARADCPASAKTWITALRVVATQDWRKAQVTAQSPLLLKIAWFQALANNLTDLAATHRLDAIIPQPKSAAAAPSNQPPPVNPELNVPDWGRAVVAYGFEISVENSGRFAAANLPLEFQELGDILKIENGEEINQQNLAATFSEPESRTMTLDANGKAIVHVIGSGIFKAASRRHLFNDLKPAFFGLAEGQGDKNAAETLCSQMNVLFRGVPQYELAQADIEPIDNDALLALVAQMHAQKIQWAVEDLSPAMTGQFPGHELIDTFYARAVPFGTVYNAEQRIHLISNIGLDEFHRMDGQDENEALRNLYAQPPSAARNAAISARVNDARAHPEKYAPQEPTAFDRSLLKLSPDCYAVATDFVLPDHLLAYAAPFLDYNMRPSERINHLASKLSDTDREMLQTKEAEFDPGACFDLASLLRRKGQYDQAAVMDRKGLAEAYDRVGMSNEVEPLVDYDFTHGLQDEALSVAQQASDVGSAQGMAILARLLGRMGQYEKAVDIATEIQSSYNDDMPLLCLYAGHPDHFPQEYARAVTNLFPDGLVRVDLTSFTQKPERACQIGNEGKEIETDQLLPGDLIVALDGYKVGSVKQYVFVRALTDDPHMDLIIWRDTAYQEVKIVAPNRKFHSNLVDH